MKKAAVIAPPNLNPMAGSDYTNKHVGIHCLRSASSSTGKVNSFSQRCRSTAPKANPDPFSKAQQGSTEERKELVLLQVYRWMPKHSKNNYLRGRQGLCKQAVTKLRFLKCCEPAMRVSLPPSPPPPSF